MVWGSEFATDAWGVEVHPLDRVNGSLAVAVAVLALWLWLGRPATTALPPLTSWHAADVNELRLYEGERVKWSVLRDKIGWTMTHPDITSADSARIDQLLLILATPSLKAWQSTPETLATFGLAEPAYRLVFDLQTIALGDTEPTSGLRYVLVDDRVHLIGDGFYHHLLAAPQAFHKAAD